MQITNPKYDIYDRVYKLVLHSLNIIKLIPINTANQILIKQLVRAITSIGANLYEANCAESKSDFIHKVAIARKESIESFYWFNLLKDSNNLKNAEIERIIQELTEITKVLSAILHNTKKI